MTKYEYRVRYLRRGNAKEKARIFGTLGSAKRYIERTKNWDGSDPFFPPEALEYVSLDRRPVGDWERDFPEGPCAPPPGRGL